MAATSVLLALHGPAGDAAAAAVLGEQSVRPSEAPDTRALHVRSTFERVARRVYRWVKQQDPSLAPRVPFKDLYQVAWMALLQAEKEGMTDPNSTGRRIRREMIKELAPWLAQELTTFSGAVGPTRLWDAIRKSKGLSEVVRTPHRRAEVIDVRVADDNADPVIHAEVAAQFRAFLARASPRGHAVRHDMLSGYPSEETAGRMMLSSGRIGQLMAVPPWKENAVGGFSLVALAGEFPADLPPPPRHRGLYEGYTTKALPLAPARVTAQDIAPVTELVRSIEKQLSRWSNEQLEAFGSDERRNYSDAEGHYELAPGLYVDIAKAKVFLEGHGPFSADSPSDLAARVTSIGAASLLKARERGERWLKRVNTLTSRRKAEWVATFLEKQARLKTTRRKTHEALVKLERFMRERAPDAELEPGFTYQVAPGIEIGVREANRAVVLVISHDERIELSPDGESATELTDALLDRIGGTLRVDFAKKAREFIQSWTPGSASWGP